jgi:hypothetical protein
VKLSFGIGIAFVPFVLAFSTEYVLAANAAANLSELAATVFSAYAWGVPLAGLTDGLVDEVPAEAMVVPDDPESDPQAATASTPFAEASSKQRRGTAKRAASPSKAFATPNPDKPLPAVYVPAATVLRIANAGQRPSGKPVTADRKRPAGVQVFGASALGIGVRDGDVITRVSGVPVTSPNQVIALVIAARGSRQKAISAQVYRGQRSYTLTVEQPYLSASNPESSPSANASSSND